MSRIDPNQALMPSIIDRLIGSAFGENPSGRWFTPDQMIESVHRDLEDLLNTRQTHAGIPEDFSESLQSVVGYGLPDLTSLNAVNAAEREAIGRVLEATIQRF